MNTRIKYDTDLSATMPRLNEQFYFGDAVTLAQKLPGMDIVIQSPAGQSRYMISETEAYLGIEDKACHASKGRTGRNEIMYSHGGHLYVYFVYGMHWMMNIVTGERDDPQAVLIRGAVPFTGPARVTKGLGINGSYNGENLAISERIWVEDMNRKTVLVSGPRIGINYAGEPWTSKPWRYIITQTIK